MRNPVSKNKKKKREKEKWPVILLAKKDCAGEIAQQLTVANTYLVSQPLPEPKNPTPSSDLCRHQSTHMSRHIVKT